MSLLEQGHALISTLAIVTEQSLIMIYTSGKSVNKVLPWIGEYFGNMRELNSIMSSYSDSLSLGIHFHEVIGVTFFPKSGC